MTETPIFRVDDGVFERFPTYVVGCVAALDIDLSTVSNDLEKLIDNAGERSRITYQGLDLKSEPPFAAWREAFSSAGWSPSRFPASSEAIHRRMQRGSDMPHINPIVDLANSAVLYYAAPVGVHDIDSFDEGPLEVRWSDERDQFIAMNGSEEPPDGSEIVYAVGSDIRTRRWVWRQGKNGRISPDARNVLFPIDGFLDLTYDTVVAAQNYLARIATDEWNATVVTAEVTRESPEFRM